MKEIYPESSNPNPVDPEPSGPGSGRPDWGFAMIVALIAVVTIWLLLTPLVSSVALASMHRFHLRSRSFAVWAVQFPIPTMYNFANRYEVREVPWGLIDPIADQSKWRYLNHFPARVVTFVDTRYRYLHAGTDRWFAIDTSYRGQRIETRMHAEPLTNGTGFALRRLDHWSDSGLNGSGPRQ